MPFCAACVEGSSHWSDPSTTCKRSAGSSPARLMLVFWWAWPLIGVKWKQAVGFFKILRMFNRHHYQVPEFQILEDNWCQSNSAPGNNCLLLTAGQRFPLHGTVRPVRERSVTNWWTQQLCFLLNTLVATGHATGHQQGLPTKAVTKCWFRHGAPQAIFLVQYLFWFDDHFSLADNVSLSGRSQGKPHTNPVKPLTDPEKWRPYK